MEKKFSETNSTEGTMSKKEEEHGDRELLFDMMGEVTGGERINEVFLLQTEMGGLVLRYCPHIPSL